MRITPARSPSTGRSCASPRSCSGSTRSRSRCWRTSSSAKRSARKRPSSVRLRDRVAIVTGGAQGIGKAYALRFAREGAHVVVADIRDGQAKEVAAECTALGPEALGIRLDVSDEASAQAVADETAQRFGRVDVLVNN